MGCPISCPREDHCTQGWSQRTQGSWALRPPDSQAKRRWQRTEGRRKWWSECNQRVQSEDQVKQAVSATGRPREVDSPQAWRLHTRQRTRRCSRQAKQATDHGKSSNLCQALCPVGPPSCRQKMLRPGMACSWLPGHGQAHHHDNYASHFYSYLHIWISPMVHHFMALLPTSWMPSTKIPSSP